MGKTKAPVIRYPISGSGPVIGSILWMTEQALTTWFGDWWPQIPWGWLTLIALVFCLGQLFADWFNKNSWLRQKYEHSRRFFDVEGCRVVLDRDRGGTHLKVICCIRFVCRVEHADLVVRVHGLLKNRRPQQHFQWTVEKDVTLNKNDQRDIILAVVPVEPGRHHSGWGGTPDHTKSVIEGSDNIVVVELVTNKQTYSHSIRLDIPNQNSGALGRVNLVDESDDMFAMETEQ